MALTERQKRFADFYIELGNIVQAALKAGYSENYANARACKLLENVGVRSYLDERLTAMEAKRIADGEEVMKYLTAVMRGETLSEIVVVEGDGDGCSSARRMSKAPDEKEKLKAAELIGKRYALFTDKSQIDLNVPVIFEGEQSLED